MGLSPATSRRPPPFCCGGGGCGWCGGGGAGLGVREVMQTFALLFNGPFPPPPPRGESPLPGPMSPIQYEGPPVPFGVRTRSSDGCAVGRFGGDFAGIRCRSHRTGNPGRLGSDHHRSCQGRHLIQHVRLMRRRLVEYWWAITMGGGEGGGVGVKNTPPPPRGFLLWCWCVVFLVVCLFFFVFFVLWWTTETPPPPQKKK